MATSWHRGYLVFGECSSLFFRWRRSLTVFSGRSRQCNLSKVARCNGPLWWRCGIVWSCTAIASLRTPCFAGLGGGAICLLRLWMLNRRCCGQACVLGLRPPAFIIRQVIVCMGAMKPSSAIDVFRFASEASSVSVFVCLSSVCSRIASRGISSRDDVWDPCRIAQHVLVTSGCSLCRGSENVVCLDCHGGHAHARLGPSKRHRARR